jgi:prepilin-type N-terminal cleavage/methylation domain-containing protein
VFASRSSARRRSRRPRDGFTLVESLIALAIVGRAAVSTVAAFGTELRTAERARRGLEAAALAEERLAMLELLQRQELAALPDSLSRGRLAPPFDAYDVSASVRPSSNARDLYDVVVNVAWEGGGYEVRARLYRPPRRGVSAP